VEHVSVRDFSVSHVFPELLVLIGGHFSLLTRPDSSEGVDYLTVELDRERDELREFLYGLFNQLLLGKLAAGG